MDLKRLNWMYVHGNSTIEEMARALGCGSSKIKTIIRLEREKDPAAWPNRAKKAKNPQ
ncbi:hypothetical protein D3C75_1383330 [compost metagenome]